MGSLDRKIERNRIRNEYKEFTKQFQIEKRFQTERLANGESLGKDEQRLGTKPSFSQFMKRLKSFELMQRINKSIAQKQKVEDDKKIDLEWKDE